MNTSTRKRMTRWGAAERVGLAGLIVGTVASVTFAGAVVTARANPADYTDPLYMACMRSSAGTPDALEHYVDTCAVRADAAKPAYDACMHGAARSPDALEHWIRPCATRALASTGSDQLDG